MTNLNLKIFISVFSTLLFFSCKTEKPAMKQAKAEIYFRFLESTQELHAEAFFFEQKTPPTPVVWDNVLFVNMIMKKRKLSSDQIRYIIDLQQPEFEKPYYIKFWNKGELPRQVDINHSDINSFSFKNAVGKTVDFIKKSESGILALDSPVFSGKENFTLLFTNENNESASLQIAPPNASGHIEISAKALASLPLGICKAEMIITKAETIDTPAAKANVISEFYSKPVQIVVRE